MDTLWHANFVVTVQKLFIVRNNNLKCAQYIVCCYAYTLDLLKS